MAKRVAEDLQTARKSEDFQKLAELFKRVKNISKDIVIEMSWEELAAHGTSTPDASERALLMHAAEKAKLVEKAQTELRYRDALMLLAELQPHVAKFFDDVMVMAEDKALRENRVRLLMEIGALFGNVADFSKIQAET